MQKVLKSYLRRLSNLSGNNRSLLLSRILKDQLIDIHDFDYIANEPSFIIVKQLIAHESEIFLCHESDSRSKQTNELSSRLKKVQRIEKFIFNERGAKDLYVGWPFVKGKFMDDTLVRCPLIFFPVELVKSENKWFIKRRPDVNITFNKTFLLAYAYYNHTTLDEELIEKVIDEYDKDSTVFRTQLYELLKGSGVELHFNQDNFADELHAFSHYSKSSIETEEQTGRIKLYPQAVLGIFPQSGSYLVPDYVKLIDDSDEKNLEEFFASKMNQNNKNQLALIDRVNEENTFTPFPMDAYQEHALKEIKKGNSLVVQGPPGTGKSQLISNLICDFIARGKNVLLVCQKKAALDIVYQRLKEKEIHDFVALIHDFKSDRKPIYHQINHQIESIDVYQKKNNGLDTIQLERGFLQASRRIDQILEQLEEFHKALFDESECGKSVKELYLISNPDKPNFSMNLEYRAFHFSRLPDTLRKFKSYLQYFERFEKRTHFWAKGPSFADFETKDLIMIESILYEIPEFGSQLISDSNSFSNQPIDFDTAHYLSGKYAELKTLIDGLKENVVFKVFKQLHVNKPTEDLNWLTRRERVMMACFRGVGMETSLTSQNLGKFQEVLQSAKSARKNPLSWIKWRLISKDKIFLKRVLVANNLKSNNKGFKILINRIDNRLNFEHSLSQITNNHWLHNFPKGFRKIDLQDWFYWQKMGLNMYAVAQTIRSLYDYINPIQLEDQAYKGRLAKLIEIGQRIPNKLDDWKRFINIHQVRAILLEKEDIKRLGKLLKKDFDTICEYHKLKASLGAEEKKVLTETMEISSKTEEGLAIFKNSLSIAWINHIESKYPFLRNVASGKLELLAEDLREQLEAKRQASKEILLLKAREKTYENVEYNRLNNRVTYRDLQHQVTKKRMVWPIRRVISEYSDELYSLLPCWMCSPESASAIFPMRENFDLVIFDEASQCFAERGIPAMYRGKQVVIAGDSMQLQPSDLYRVRWEGEEEDAPEFTIESLLNLAKLYLPEVRLAGHYRSKSLELIDFSNRHFYKGKLRLLPDYKHVNTEKPSIDFVKIHGVWKDGLNEIEAEKVVALALNHIKMYPDKDLGIVTFNFRQQVYISDLLESESAKQEVLLPKSLFVKNIENVQGDERDVIIFSITYAPDENNQIRLQFGSLNVEGGENRLNVAVTRAREKVIVASSLLPKELNTEDTKNEGPKLLEKYLNYAWQVNNKEWKPYLPKYQDHHVDWFLRKKLQKKSFHHSEDFKLAKDLPFADLSVKKGNTYTGLILTDDERYYEALSPKQIYGFQHFHLSMKNWPHARFHSREYWLDREEAREKMRRFLFSNQ
ncbi:MAG: AAA domain-containing protein [Bacteroidota bacterium]